MLTPTGEMAALEAAALAELELEPGAFGKMPYGTHEGARRPLRVPLSPSEITLHGLTG